MHKRRERFSDPSRFWVIFDTCQLNAYYQDLHNLLALPAGAIIRYDYRARYISPSAVAMIKGTATAPRDVLLIYVQHEGYRRGVGLDYRPNVNEGIFLVPTRLARMRLIPNIGGEKYAFDLELKGYPKLDFEALDEIWQRLAESNQTPWSKWVTISASVKELAKLQCGTNADNWSTIADRLGAPPSQFHGDVFWRVDPPLLDREHIIAPTFEMEAATAPGGVRQVSFSFPLTEGHFYDFELFSHGSHHSTRQLRVTVPQSGPLQYDGSPTIDLRYDAATHIVVRGQRAETVDDRFGLLTLDSGDPVNGWPIGPRLTFQFKIFKSKGAVVIGVILLLIAVVLGAAAEHTWKDSLSVGIASALGAAACILVGVAVLTRKIGVKL
jgi:hypothetical protein